MVVWELHPDAANSLSRHQRDGQPHPIPSTCPLSSVPPLIRSARVCCARTLMVWMTLPSAPSSTTGLYLDSGLRAEGRSRPCSQRQGDHTHGMWLRGGPTTHLASSTPKISTAAPCGGVSLGGPKDRRPTPREHIQHGHCDTVHDRGRAQHISLLNTPLPIDLFTPGFLKERCCWWGRASRVVEGHEDQGVDVVPRLLGPLGAQHRMQQHVVLQGQRGKAKGAPVMRSAAGRQGAGWEKQRKAAMVLCRGALRTMARSSSG